MTIASRASSWDQRYATHGEFASVGPPHFNAADYYRQAAEFWSYAQAVMPERVGTVLDFGCGTGRFVPYLMAHTHRYKGADVSRNAIKTAHKRYRAPGIEFGTVHDWRPSAGGIDAGLLWCCTVLQHITDDAELGATLEWAGSHCWSNCTAILIESTADQRQGGENICYRTIGEYEQALSAAGFAVESTQRIPVGKHGHSLIVAQRGPAQPPAVDHQRLESLVQARIAAGAAGAPAQAVRLMDTEADRLRSRIARQEAPCASQ